MRGTVAKRLRRQVYADRPTNPRGRRYQVVGRFFRKFKVRVLNKERGEHEQVERRYEVTTLGADEYRRRYRAAKKAYKRRSAR